MAIGGPPGAGATTLLRQIVATLAEAQPDLAPIVVLAGVRPEEVTEWRATPASPSRAAPSTGSVDEQAQAAEMAIERGKRAVEAGRHAVVVDRLARRAAARGRPARVRRGAARTEEGGSLTVSPSPARPASRCALATTRIVLEPAAAAGPALARIGHAARTC